MRSYFGADIVVGVVVGQALERGALPPQLRVVQQKSVPPAGNKSPASVQRTVTLPIPAKVLAPKT